MNHTLTRHLLAAAGLAFICALPGLACEPRQPSHDDQLGKADLIAADASRDLKHSFVAATLSEPHKDATSLLWCSTLQLAWNELGTEMGGPLQVGNNATANAMNSAKESKADLDAASYVALAGFGQNGIVERIKKDLETRFKGAASPKMLPASVPPGHILAYAYLFKNLEFKDPFIKAKVPLTFGESKLKAFGVWGDHEVQNWSAIASQVAIHRYTDAANWTVELRTKAAEDRLIIARLAPGKTLAETTDLITASLRDLEAKPDKDAPSFDYSDDLIVPLMNFDVTRSFNELTGLEIAGAKASGTIDYAKQNIRFRLDEKGAILKSEAAIGVTASAMPRHPKRMVCDGPFAVVMMRKGAAHPYFVAWIDNPELLVRWK